MKTDTDMEDGRESQMERRLAALESRVAALEEHPVQQAPLPAGGVPSASPERLWAVDVLRSRSGPPFVGATSRGSLMYAGALTAPGAGVVVWQIERPAPGVLEHDWSSAAPVLAALGHPVRLEIVRRLLNGAHTSQELQEIADLGTTGRLYHHLRELQACGVIVSPRRNYYAIPPQNVVPCLVIVAAAALELGGQTPVSEALEEGAQADDH